MRSFKVAVLLCLFGLLALPAVQTQAAVFHSPKGYALEYPDGWQVATADQQSAINDAAKKMVQNVDFSTTDSFFYDPALQGSENVNVVVVSEALSITEQSRAAMEAGELKQLSSTGLAPKGFRSQIIQIGSTDAIYTTWTATSGARQVSQQQYLITGKLHAYILTCTAPVESAAAAESTFKAIANSFHVDSEPGGAFEKWWAGLPSAVRGGILGGVFGGLIGVGKTLLKRNRSRS